MPPSRCGRLGERDPVALEALLLQVLDEIAAGQLTVLDRVAGRDEIVVGEAPARRPANEESGGDIDAGRPFADESENRRPHGTHAGRHPISVEPLGDGVDDGGAPRGVRRDRGDALQRQRAGQWQRQRQAHPVRPAPTKKAGRGLCGASFHGHRCAIVASMSAVNRPRP